MSNTENILKEYTILVRKQEKLLKDGIKLNRKTEEMLKKIKDPCEKVILCFYMALILSCIFLFVSISLNY
jgi:hypothetical protein